MATEKYSPSELLARLVREAKNISQLNIPTKCRLKMYVNEEKRYFTEYYFSKRHGVVFSELNKYNYLLSIEDLFNLSSIDVEFDY